MKQTRCITLCGLFLLATASFALPHHAAEHNAIKGRALLVGIERYKDVRVPAAPGCVRDARELSQFIQTRFGFPADSVKLLLNEQATAANIDQTFVDWLVKGTNPGERAFFFYAGHGSQLRDDNGDEDDGYDETIAPYDVNPRTGRNEIRDDRFEQLIAQLSGRMAVLVFDSCHSGTISRGVPELSQFPQGGGARYLPRPDQFNELLADGSSRGIGGLGSYRIESTHARDLRYESFVKPEKLGALAGVVVISAARADQRAYPVKVDGEFRGALAYTFEDAQSEGAPSVRDLEQQIRTRIDQLHHDRKLVGDQQPQFEVVSSVPLDDQPLFASFEEVPAVALANPLSAIKISLRSGENKERYRIGETISYRIATDTPGYLYLLVFSQENVATCIFPAKDEPGRLQDNRVEAGALLLPRGGYEFPIQEPAGRDIVVALLAPGPLDLGEKIDYTWSEVFARLNLRRLQQALGVAATRGQGVVKKNIPLTGANWQAATFVVETIR